MVVMTAGDFALTAAALHGEWWRLWTGHLVHYDLGHLITNAVAIAVPLALVDMRERRRLLLAMPIIAPALSVLLLACARFDEYRGASGLALAVWAGAGLTLARSGADRDRGTGYALLVIAVAKLAAEAAGTGHVWNAVAALPLAHMAGFLAGLLVANGVRRPRRAPHTRSERYCAGTYVGSAVVLSITEPYAVTRPVPEIT